MAKQAGPIYFKGTIGGITCYKMDGNFYARAKSSLDSNRVKKDKAFASTRWHAYRFGRGAKLASSAYGMLGNEKKDICLYWKWMGMAATMLYAGKEESEVLGLLSMEAEKVLGLPKKKVKGCIGSAMRMHPKVIAVPYRRIFLGSFPLAAMGNWPRTYIPKSLSAKRSKPFVVMRCGSQNDNYLFSSS